MYNPLHLRRQARQLFKENSLFRNASYLMASTGIMSILGFGFWIFVAHLYKPSDIGIAASLISISALLTNFSMFGLNSGLVRFLPHSKNQSRDINAAIAVVGLVSMGAAAIYLIVGSHYGADLHFFTASPLHTVLFLAIMAVVSLNTLTDAIFIANRQAQYHTMVYALFGVVRLLLPLVLVPLGWAGIFIAFTVATLLSLLLSFVFMWRSAGYRLLVRPNWSLLSQTRKYAANNYVAVLMSGFPAQIMPLLIVRRLGTAEVAFFSMAWTMANLLYVIPSSITQSLLAESSHDPQAKTRNSLHAIRLLSIILIPAVIIAVTVAPYMLRIFGEQYSEGSTRIFQFLAIATLSIAINSVANTTLNIEHRSSSVVASQAVALVVTLIAVTALIGYGLAGVGAGMLLGYMSANIVHLYSFTIGKRRHLTQQSLTPHERLLRQSTQLAR